MAKPWNKASVSRIVANHLGTFKDAYTKQPLPVEKVWFFGVPALIGGTLALSGVVVNDTTINLLATSLSIFAALLFNLIILIVDMVRKNKQAERDARDPSEKRKIEKKGVLMEELNHTVAFEILLAVAALILLFILVLPSPMHKGAPLNHGRAVVSFVATSVVACFVFHLFIVLKRIYRLIDDEFAEEPHTPAPL